MIDGPMNPEPPVLEDPFKEANDPMIMGWLRGSASFAQDAMNVEAQFDDYSHLDIYEMFSNPQPPPPPPMEPPKEETIEMPDPEEWVRPEQLGRSLNEPPAVEAGGINECIDPPEDHARAVQFGRTKSFFGRKPVSFIEKMMLKMKKAEPIKFDEEEAEGIGWEESKSDPEDSGSGEDKR